MDMGCNGIDIPGGATLCSRGSNEPLDFKKIYIIYIYI